MIDTLAKTETRLNIIPNNVEVLMGRCPKPQDILRGDSMQVNKL